MAALSQAAEAPYFVTYDHHLEEPGNLEVALNQATGAPDGGNRFAGSVGEFEYGVKTWWTTEVYLASEATRHEGGLFTGYRWENRFRLLMGEHWINPVLYVELANTNGADRSMLEIVGHDGMADQLEPTAEARLETEREIETRLILSSNFKGWNVSENFIAEKNFSNEPWEFGYAFGASRPLGLEASPRPCRFCRENFSLGGEIFGGLGTRHSLGLRDTSHYAAPVLAWALPGGTTFRVSPAFGLNGNSYGCLLRVGVSYEIDQFRKLWRRP